MSAPVAALGPQDLTTYASQHYRIHTNLSRREAAAYGVHMDRIFVQYTRRFESFRQRDRSPMPLHLVRHRQEYIDLLRGFGFDATASGGMFFYSSAARGLATWVQDKPHATTLETLQHEGFHQFAHAYIGHHLPVWVNEGLAEYFGDGLLVEHQMKVGLATPRRVQAVQEAVRQHTAIDFDRLLDMTGDQWHANMRHDSPLGPLQYHQSWSIVYFLIHGDGGKYRKAFEKYLVLVNKGRLSQTAFRQAFGTQDTTAFHRRWQQYVLDLEPDPLATAITRLGFIARAMKYLHDQSRPVPTTLGQLREVLQAVEFRVTWSNHGKEVVMSAKDESLYGFRRANGSVGTFELLEPEADDLLPRVTARGLRPELMLAWSRDTDGCLQWRIRYR